MSASPVRVLLIEDDPVDALLVRRGLEHSGTAGWHLTHVTTLREGREMLAKGDVDVVLLDLHLPDGDGIESIDEMMACAHEHERRAPVVVLTGMAEQEMALQALRAGAQDYVVKDEIRSWRLLERAARYAIERQRTLEEKERLEERLRRTEQLEGAGVLAAGVAFSFDTLLGKMLDELDQAIDEMTELGHAARIRKRLLEIRRGLTRASELSDQLRSWISTSPMPPAPIELSSFVLEMAHLVEAVAREPAEVSFNLPAGVPRVSFRGIELRQVIFALVLNGVEAIGDRPGQVAIETGVMHVNEELFARAQGTPGLAPGEYVFLSVADDGPGLAAQARERVFDPFYTPAGAATSGVGLFTALGIVRRHGGAILCSSKPGRGTRFTVLMPPTHES